MSRMQTLEEYTKSLEVKLNKNDKSTLAVLKFYYSIPFSRTRKYRESLLEDLKSDFDSLSNEDVQRRAKALISEIETLIKDDAE